MLLDKTILIRAPPRAVFGWLAPARQTLWDKSLVRASSRDEPLHAGSIVERVTRALGFRFASTTEAVAFEEGRIFAWRQLEGDFEENRGAFVLEAAPGGATKLRFLADVELPFVLPRLTTEAEVRETLSRSADDALFNLKALLEARA